MPNNMRHIGLIHLMLPNARIIDARREPMACCFSNFKQLFAQGQEFTYSFDDIARYYRTYLELMEHWDACCRAASCGSNTRTSSPTCEGSVGRMLEFCGLEFEPLRGVSHHRAQRAHRQLGAGAPAHLSGKASISGRTTKRGWAAPGRPRRCADALSGPGGWLSSMRGR